MSAIPPRRNVLTQLTSTYATGDGYQPNSRVQRYAVPAPVPNPPILLGVDYVTLELDIGRNVVTFPNLPIRGVNNPNQTTQNQPQPITVRPNDLFIFEVSLGSPQVIGTDNTVYDAPSVGAGTYKTFNTVIMSGSMNTVTVFGKLYLCKGAVL